MTPLSPEIQAELAKLHDIRLPAPVGWWPLAPGWWALLAILLIGCLAVIAMEIRRHRSVRYVALREIAGLKSRLTAAKPAPEIATDLAVLLRRVVLSGPEARRLATLSGPGWVAELGLGADGLSGPVAAYLADAPYAPADLASNTNDQLRTALSESETWIRRHA